MRCCLVPRTKQPEHAGQCSRCGPLGSRSSSYPPTRPTLGASLAALTAVPLLSQKPSERATSIWLWEQEGGAERAAFVLSFVKNKLIHAELNSQVQLDNQSSPSGSVNFAVFTSGFSTATLTSTKNWEPLDKVCTFTTHELQFKFSCGFVPGGKSPFRGTSTVPRFRNFG